MEAPLLTPPVGPPPVGVATGPPTETGPPAETGLPAETAMDPPIVSDRFVTAGPADTNHATSHSIGGGVAVEGMGKHFLPIVVHVRFLRIQSSSPLRVRVTRIERVCICGAGAVRRFKRSRR